MLMCSTEINNDAGGSAFSKTACLLFNNLGGVLYFFLFVVNRSNLSWAQMQVKYLKTLQSISPIIMVEN